MLLNRYLLALMFGMFLSHSVAAQDPTMDLSRPRVLGLGVIFGEPTGFTGKWFIGRDWAIDMNVSYSFFEFLHIHGNSVWHFHNLMSKLHPDLADLSSYLGAGLGIRVSSKDKPKSGDARANAYFRFPFGLEYFLKRPTLAPFLEIAPGMGFAPKVYGLFQGGIGCRYYF